MPALRKTVTPTTVWLNGRLTSLSRAKLGVLDAGFQCGDGVFETVAARNGHLIAPLRHWHRLVYSCRALRLHTVSPDEFEAALWAVLGCSGLSEARLRFSISRGVGGKQTYLVTAAAMPDYTQPEKLVLSPWCVNRRGPLQGIKSLSYAGQLRVREEAKRLGAGEALMCTEDGELSEASTCNVFVVKEGRIQTPWLESGCLPGVTRAIVIESCLLEGIRIEERALAMSDCRQVEEAFLTSCLRGVQPVVQWLEQTLPAPGPVTAQVMAIYQRVLLSMQSENLSR